jgi:hypothetical protein
MLRPTNPRDPHRASADEFMATVFVSLELLEAWQEAEEKGLSPCQVAVPWPELRKIEVPESIMLFLLFYDQVEHLRPVRGPDGLSCLVPNESLLLTDQSHFALNECGRVAVDDFLGQVLMLDPGCLEAAWDHLHLGRFTPAYDSANRVFVWGQHLLKQFRQPAHNQEAILLAAEEMSWPFWFDDPLPKAPGMNPKVRLHDTIKWLNQRQAKSLIHFKGDGTGTRLGWEYR